MSNIVVDEIHAATAYLEAEGHPLAAHFRDLVNRLRGDAKTVEKDGADLVGQLVTAVSGAVGPELDRVKAEAATEGKALFGQLLDAAAPVLAAGTTDAHKALADAFAAVRSALPTAPAAK